MEGKEGTTATYRSAFSMWSRSPQMGLKKSVLRIRETRSFGLPCKYSYYYYYYYSKNGMRIRRLSSYLIFHNVSGLVGEDTDLFVCSK